MSWEYDTKELIHRHVKPYDKAAQLASAVVAIPMDVINRQRNEADRLDVVIDDLSAELDRIRVALGGYHDSDLVSLATTLRERCDYLESLDDERNA